MSTLNITEFHSTSFHWIAVAVVIITASARLTRLATHDKFPPALWLRNKYGEWTESDSHPRRLKWQLLMYCGYCFSFWGTALVVITADLTGQFDGVPAGGVEHGHWLYVLWWFLFGTFGGSYLAAILMAYDGDPGDTEASQDTEAVDSGEGTEH